MPGPIIAVSDLRLAVLRILDAVEMRRGAEVDLDADYYWSLDDRTVFEMAGQPTPASVGQLSDDVESVGAFLRSPPDEAVVVWHELAHVTAILRRIGVQDLP